MNPQAAELFDSAKRFAAAGDYVPAFKHILQSLAQDRSHAESWDMLARLQLQLGNESEAVQAAAVAVRIAPQSADCQYMYGRTLKAVGRIDEAIEHYRTAITLSPTRAIYFCSLGIALRNVGRLQDAIVSYRAALTLDPGNIEAKNNLANVLRLTGEGSGVPGLVGANSTLSRDLDRLVEEAARLHWQGQYSQAYQRWTDVLRLAPDSAPAHHALAATLNAMHLFDEALTHEEKALSLDPNHREALDGARKLAMFAGEVEKVAHYGQRLQVLQRSDALRITSSLALPVVHESPADIAHTRECFEAALDELLQAPLAVARPNQSVGNLSFYLAYHGENNRRVQQKLGRLMVQSCAELTWTAPHCRSYRPQAGRIRIGFASELLKNHSIGKTSAGLIAELDRERFEVFVLNLPGSAKTEDATTQFIRSHCDHWRSFDGELEQVRTEVANLQLDILFYQDIGMTPFSYYLAYSRLAPLQCVSYGHPDTTGIPNLDYFISNDLYEPEGGAEHYTERLAELHNLPTLAYYYRPEIPTGTGISRAQWELAAEEHLYVCAQTLFKLHPDFDALLAGILELDPKARIVLIDGQYKGWTARLKRRFAQRMGEHARRITFIGRMNSEQYLALLGLADVALDTIHFNGMNSSLEALAMGTPVVTWPRHLQRGRHTQAMYRQMEIDDCIAEDAQSYVDIAVRIASEPDLRHSLRQRILERNSVLFENRRVVTEFERFFTETLQRSRAE